MHTNPNDLQNKLAIITGASFGIGKAIAEALIANGSVVINADISKPFNAPDSPRYHFCKTDITRADEIENLYANVGNIGSPNILICNASIGIYKKMKESNPDNALKIIDLHLVDLLRMPKRFIPLLLKHQKPEIVFIVNMEAFMNSKIYVALNTAIEGHASWIRLKLNDKVRITVIAPGVIDTPTFKSLVMKKITHPW